jgi:hypothetical protein
MRLLLMRHARLRLLLLLLARELLRRILLRLRVRLRLLLLLLLHHHALLVHALLTARRRRWNRAVGIRRIVRHAWCSQWHARRGVRHAAHLDEMIRLPSIRVRRVGSRRRWL